MHERIVILDFGGQYSSLIARRVREAGAYSELLPYDADIKRIKGSALSGIILTGGPGSVNEHNTKECADEVFDLGVPVLGICYGMQYIAARFFGAVEKMAHAETGIVEAVFSNHPLFYGLNEHAVFMTHTDRVIAAPRDFEIIASTQLSPIAAFANDERRLYGVQFHPEVHAAAEGIKIIKNFLKLLCGLSLDYSPKSLAEGLIQDIALTVGSGRILGAFSGGVDSAVASVLAHKAAGERLSCIFVDHGLLRKNEALEVMRFYHDELNINIVHIDARERFLKRLQGVIEPEEKRKIIGEEFIRVFEEEAKKLNADYLLQGTIYTDVIESGTKTAHTIKSHHNVGGLPEDIGFKGLVEPLRMLFKDEVRLLGESLGIPPALVWRQPFPGPGLAIRVLGEVTEEKLELVRQSDYILREEIKSAGLLKELFQYFTVFTGIKSVGVSGDRRTYDYALAIRAVHSTDAMTVEAAELPYPLLKRISSRILSEVKHVNRVVYDLTDKPPGTVEWE